MEAPEGIPAEFPAYVRLMLDLVVLAFQTDATRIATFVLANEGSNRTFPWIEVRDGHHSLSHHGGNVEKLEKIQKIDQFYVDKGDIVPEMVDRFEFEVDTTKANEYWQEEVAENLRLRGEAEATADA